MGYAIATRPGCIYHVVTRGNNKRRIYRDDVDRCCSSARPSSDVAQKYGWTILAYCLMDNHYHLVLEHRRAGHVARHVRAEHRATHSHFNARHGRVNHLFGKRYWSRELRTDATLVNAVRYVDAEPACGPAVRDRSSGTSGASYAATIGAGVRAASASTATSSGALRHATPSAQSRRIRASAPPSPRSHVRWQPP